ncbi:MAG: hypothetical protein ACRDE2_06965, partial [Chitinophagaceae bacterium]
INPEQFTIDYGIKRFGLSGNEGELLWNYLSHNQEIIGSDTEFEKQDVAEIRNKFQQVSLPVKLINPKRNQKEFEHFKLMADIRLFYLTVRQVESITEASTFNRSERGSIGEMLKQIVENSKELNQRFIQLNKGYLFDSELTRLNNLRNERMNRLWNIYGS